MTSRRAVAPIVLVLALIAPGCTFTPPDASGVITATPRPFPYAGMYSGTPQGGTVTLLMRADGRGIGCVRGIGGGIVSAGDIRYDGAFIYTEDGPLTVDSISEAEILAHISGTKFTLHRITETPAACRDVFPSTK